MVTFGWICIGISSFILIWWLLAHIDLSGPSKQSPGAAEPSILRKHFDRRAAMKWARYVNANKHRYLILDTETTGLRERDEIIELAIIDFDGNALFNERIRPTHKKRMAPKAQEAHGIKMKELNDCPQFNSFAEPLKAIFEGKTVIAYNAAFDKKLFMQTYKANGGCPPPEYWQCAMLKYASFVTHWNSYHGNYRWHKLQGGDHTALGDCRATLALINKMAAAGS